MAGLSRDEIAELLTDETIRAIAPNVSAPIRKALRDDGPQVFADASIHSIVRIAHFFAQILKETGGLRRLDENLNYTTVARLRAVWPSRFPTDQSAAPYIERPEKLANFVYANRNGNGDVSSGDGWRYRGSGLIQLTGKGNFRTVGELIGVGDDLVENPDQVREPPSAALIAAGYWTARDINSVADGTSNAAVDRVTRKVNPFESDSGKRDRREFFKHALEVLTNVGASVIAPIPADRETDPAEERSTEPTAAELLADRTDDLGIPGVRLETLRSIPPVYWPSDDANSADYFHLAHLATDAESKGDFALQTEDIVLLMEANAFVVPEGQDVVSVALRGATLGGVHEQVKKEVVRCMDVRPDHSNFRCAIGFWHRNANRITLFSASTVPAPKYMKNYYFKKNGLPYTMNVDCNMLPTGHYVFRVGAHDGGTIRPALRMSEPGNLDEDASVCVWRTFNDLTYGLADPLEPPRRVYDNVHCSYFLNYNSAYEAAFSSAGCLTVRGKKDPSDQWEKYQAELNRIGNGNRTDMVFLTGKEAALASQGRMAGRDRNELLGMLQRLRIGSSGDRVKKLQRKLAIGDDGSFGPQTQQALHIWQKANGHKPDAVYSPLLDQATGWGVF